MNKDKSLKHKAFFIWKSLYNIEGYSSGMRKL